MIQKLKTGNGEPPKKDNDPVPASAPMDTETDTGNGEPPPK